MFCPETCPEYFQCQRTPNPTTISSYPTSAFRSQFPPIMEDHAWSKKSFNFYPKLFLRLYRSPNLANCTHCSLKPGYKCSWSFYQLKHKQNNSNFQLLIQVTYRFSNLFPSFITGAYPVKLVQNVHSEVSSCI